MGRKLLLVTLASLWAMTAQAQDADRDPDPDLTAGSSHGGQGWSVLSGKSLGAGHKAIHGQVGWPGLVGTFLYGATPSLDLGARLSLLYGFEGWVTGPTVPGLKL